MLIVTQLLQHIRKRNELFHTRNRSVCSYRTGGLNLLLWKDEEKSCSIANDIFIPAMRRLSPSYREYYQNLLKANEVFLERFPDLKDRL